MNIRELCYELYKVDWKHSHMITKEIEMDTIKNYYRSLVTETSSDYENYKYEDFLNEFGYDGKYEMYADFEEFCMNEYLIERYILGLLDNDKLMEMYCKDVKMFFGKEVIA